MINILFSRERNRIEINFNGPRFYEILDFVSEEFLSYKKKYRIWTGSIRKIRRLIPDFKELDDVNIDNNVLKLFEENLNKKETKYVRRKFQPELLNFTPWKGKHPNENYQIEDIKQGIRQNRLYLAHEQGLGKTVILIGIINHLYGKEFDRIMIVCPLIGIINWKKEILKFSNLFTEDDIFTADRFNRRPFEHDPKIIILSYTTFRLLSDDYYKLTNPKGKSKKYQKPTIPFDLWGSKRCIILDEAQNIRNKTARQTHIILLHRNYFDYRYEASGTPDPNGIEGYWTQMEFLDEGIINNDYYDWLREVAHLGNKYSKYVVTGYKYDKVAKFIKSTRSHVIRRLSKDHLDLPELYIKKIYVKLSKKQGILYKHVCNYVLLKVIEQEDEKLRRSEKVFHETRRMIEKFPYIFQALDNPCLLAGKIDKKKSPVLYNLIEKWKFEDHSKLEIIEYLLNQYIKDENRKVILWSGHPLTIDQLGNYFSKYKPFLIHGKIGVGKPEIRNEILSNFRNNKMRNLLIASYYVIKTSINLVEVTRSVYFDRPNDYEPWSQSIKRIHRIGQDDRVIINPLIFEKSINSHRLLPEQKQDGRLEFRNTLNEMLFNQEALTLKEWRNIFDGKDIFV